MQRTLRGAQRRFQPGGTGGEIEHRRHTPIGRHGVEGEDGTHACRQHDAHAVARPRTALQRVAERERRADDLVVSEHAAVAIHQDGALAAELAPRIQQRMENRFGIEDEIGRDEFFAGGCGDSGQGQDVFPHGFVCEPGSGESYPRWGWWQPVRPKGIRLTKEKGRPREATALFPVMRTNPGGGRLTMSFEYGVSFPKIRLTQWIFAHKIAQTLTMISITKRCPCNDE